MEKSSESDRIGSIPSASLNAYIDDEMDQQQRLDMQRAVPADAVASRYVEDMQSIQRLLGATLDDAGHQPPSKELKRTLLRLKAGRNSRRRSTSICRSSWISPILNSRKMRWRSSLVTSSSRS